MRPLPILLNITLWAAGLGAATVTSSWQSTAGGSWFEANKWGNSPSLSAFPNNGADSFDVTVGLSHFNPYGVTIITPATVNGTVYDSITVRNLNISHANATVSQVGASSQMNVTGILSISAGNCNLAGGMLTAGAVNLSGGVLSLAGGTLSPTSVTLNGGVVAGGSLTTTGAGSLHLTNSGNTLDGTQLIGGLVFLEDGGRLKLRNDATFGPAGATLGKSSNYLHFEGSATDHDATVSSAINLDGTSASVVLEGPGGGMTLNLAPGGSLRGRGTVCSGGSYSGVFTLANQGTISADIAGQTLAITTPNFDNLSGGLIRSINGAILTINPNGYFNNEAGATLSVSGGSTLNLSQHWHNAGTLSLADTSVLNLQGSFATADLGAAGWSRTNGGGTVKLQGALNNSGAILDLGACGPIVLDGGTITGGVVTAVAGSDLRPGSQATSALDAVSYQGPLVFNQSNQRLRLRNDASITAKAVNFTGSSCNLSFEATASDTTATISGLSLNLDGSNNTLSLTGPSPVLTIAANAKVRGAGFFSHGASGLSTVVNQGMISADIPGQTLLLSMSALSNTGVLQAANASILSLPMALANQPSGVFLLSGGFIQVNSSGTGAEMVVGQSARLEGYGEVRFNNSSTDSVALDGPLDPTPGPGGLVIKGNLVPSASATLAFDIAGSTQGTGYDFVSEIGTSPLNLAGSTLKVTLAHGFTPSNAQTFTVLTSNQNIAGSFGNVASGARLTTSDGYGSFLATYTGNSVVLSDFQPTPQAAYLAWADNAFRGSVDPTVVGDSADPDGDGVPNILEFALNGDPASATSKGLTFNTLQDLDPAQGREFGLTIACRQGAVFSAQPDGSQRNANAVNSVHYAVQGGVVLGNWNAAVLHSGSSMTGPAGSNLPDLTGTGWEYHTFYLDPVQASGPGRFLRVVVDNEP